MSKTIRKWHMQTHLSCPTFNISDDPESMLSKNDHIFNKNKYGMKIHENESWIELRKTRICY